MKVRIFSDLHVEFGMFLPEKSFDEDKTHLILAGDIFIGEKHWMPIPFFEDISERFAQVIIVPGNHEFYEGVFPETIGTIRNIIREFPNIELLEKQSLVIEDVAFIGATLWTDMDKRNWFTIQRAKDGMSDYSIISHRNRRLHPEQTIEDHFAAKKYIFEEITKHQKANRRTVVITHHAPCSLSIPERFRNDPLNGAYYSDLSNEILDTQPTLWVHGHLHDSSDYFLGNTRVICNPRGYVGHQMNKEFDQFLTIELPDRTWPDSLY